GLAEEVELAPLFSKPASVSPRGTPLWDVLGRVVDNHYPGARLLPRLLVGFTDSPYFRARGAVAYGFGLFSRTLTAETMAARFHGNDERIDVESLALTTQVWLEGWDLFLGGEARAPPGAASGSDTLAPWPPPVCSAPGEALAMSYVLCQCGMQRRDEGSSRRRAPPQLCGCSELMHDSVGVNPTEIRKAS